MLALSAEQKRRRWLALGLGRRHVANVHRDALQFQPRQIHGDDWTERVRLTVYEFMVANLHTRTSAVVDAANDPAAQCVALVFEAV